MQAVEEARTATEITWNDWCALAELELAQRAWEGWDAQGVALPRLSSWSEWDAFCARLDALPRALRAAQAQPQQLADIKAARRSAEHRYAVGACAATLQRRIRQAWAGRCAGGDVPGALERLSLALLEEQGGRFETAQLARRWLSCLPYLSLKGAERVTYAYLVREGTTWEAAASRNPYRECASALTRGVLYGLVCPGRPAEAAELAWQDARMSHTGSGLYSAMFVAASLAVAFVASDPEEVLYVGAGEVPDASPLYEAVMSLLAARRKGAPPAEAAAAALDFRGRPLPAGHALRAVGLVAYALLWGDGQVRRALQCIDHAQCGGEDLAGAVAKGVAGAILGALDVDDGSYSLPAGLEELAARTEALARTHVAAA